MANYYETFVCTEQDLNALILEKTGHEIGSWYWYWAEDYCTSTNKIIFIYARRNEGQEESLYAIQSDEISLYIDKDIEITAGSQSTEITNKTNKWLKMVRSTLTSNKWNSPLMNSDIQPNDTDVYNFTCLDKPFQNGVRYDKSNNLTYLLMDTADAIRSKQLPVYQEEKIALTHQSINTWLVSKTGYGTSQDSILEYAMQNYWEDHICVFIYIQNSYSSEFGSGDVLLCINSDSEDLNLSKISVVEDSNGVTITNLSNDTVGYLEFGLSNDLWDVEGTGSGINVNDSRTYSGTLGVSPFTDSTRTEIVSQINAQNFPDEIENLPEGGEMFGKSVLSNPITIDSGTSQRPGPYDQDGYNYDHSIPTPSASNTVTVGITESLTNYSTMYLIWDMVGTENPYGDVYSKVAINGNQTTLFEDTSSISTNTINGEIITTINITAIIGIQSLSFTNYAYTRSDYRGYTSEAVTNLKHVYIK